MRLMEADVDALAQAPGRTGQKTALSGVCAGLDERVTAFGRRPRPGPYPCVRVGAQLLKVHTETGG